MAALLGLAPAAQAQSTIIFDNLSGNVLGWAPISPAATLYAQSFATGGENDTFQSVILSLYEWQPNGGFTVQLFDSTGLGGAPGARLLTLLGNDSPGSGNYTYTGAFELNPNTTYWVEAEVNPSFGAHYEWSATMDSPTIGSGAKFASSDDGGATWSQNPSLNLLMQVEVTPAATPEPSAIALAGLGGTALLIFRRRK